MPSPGVVEADSVDDAGSEEVDDVMRPRMPPIATILVMTKNINNKKVMMTGFSELSRV